MHQPLVDQMISVLVLQKVCLLCVAIVINDNDQNWYHKKKIYVKVFVTVHMYVCIAYKRVIAMKFDVKPAADLQDYCQDYATRVYSLLKTFVFTRKRSEIPCA